MDYAHLETLRWIFNDGSHVEKDEDGYEGEGEDDVDTEVNYEDDTDTDPRDEDGDEARTNPRTKQKRLLGNRYSIGCRQGPGFSISPAS